MANSRNSRPEKKLEFAAEHDLKDDKIIVGTLLRKHIFYVEAGIRMKSLVQQS
jgi:hypothetical protein